MMEENRRKNVNKQSVIKNYFTKTKNRTNSKLLQKMPSQMAQAGKRTNLSEDEAREERLLVGAAKKAELQARINRISQKDGKDILGTNVTKLQRAEQQKAEFLRHYHSKIRTANAIEDSSLRT